MRKKNFISTKLLFSLVITLIVFLIVLFYGPSTKILRKNKEGFAGEVQGEISTQPGDNYIGCYIDRNPRAMNGNGGDGVNGGPTWNKSQTPGSIPEISMTPDECKEAAIYHKYNYYGLQFFQPHRGDKRDRGQCFLSNDLNATKQYGEDKNGCYQLDSRVTNNPGRIVGGGSRNAVYSTQTYINRKYKIQNMGNTDYPGNDLGYRENVSFKDCSDWCDNTPGCVGFTTDGTTENDGRGTYKHDGTRCWIKNKLENAQNNSRTRQTFKADYSLKASNTDCYGDDIESQPGTLEDGYQKCLSRPDCKVITVNNGQSRYWLKSKCSNPIKDTDRQSYQMNNRLPTMKEDYSLLGDNTDCYGDDIESQLGTLEDGYQRSLSRPDSKVITVNKNNTRYWLKSKCSNPRYDTDRTSYQKKNGIDNVQQSNNASKITFNIPKWR
jgi:hypothetical protein